MSLLATTSNYFTDIDGLYNYVLNQVKSRMQWLIYNQCITCCEDDRNECLQIMRIKIYDLVCSYLNEELPFSNDLESLVLYTKKSLKNSAIDYNRRRFERSIPAKLSLHDSQDFSDLEKLIDAEHQDNSHHYLEQEMTVHEICSQISNEMKRLSPESWHIVSSKVLEEKTTIEIANELNMTSAQLNRKTRQALAEMKELARHMHIDLKGVFDD